MKTTLIAFLLIGSSLVLFFREDRRVSYSHPFVGSVIVRCDAQKVRINKRWTTEEKWMAETEEIAEGNSLILALGKATWKSFFSVCK